MPKVDPFIRLACDINGVSYDEGEGYRLVDKLAIMSFLQDDPDLRQRYAYIRSPRPVISQADFARLDKYYHLTDHLNGNYPFTKMTNARYFSSSKDHIPKHIQKITEVLFDNYHFCFHLDFDHSSPRTIVGSILIYGQELIRNLHDTSDVRSDIKALAALRDFVPSLSDYDKHGTLGPLLEEIENLYVSLVVQVHALNVTAETILPHTSPT